LKKLNSDASPNEILSVRGLSHAYAQASRHAHSPEALVARITFADLTLCAGEIGLVQGASGAGKSTLLHLIVGALRIESGCGAIVVDGQSLGTKKAITLDAMRPHIIGWVPQRVHLLSSLRVIDNVVLPLAMKRALTQSERDRAQALMRDAGIAKLATYNASDISVGQAARVCLVRALLAAPKLLVADEPTASLDDESARSICRMIAAYVHEGGCALLASHDPRIEAYLGDDSVPIISHINVNVEVQT
jgi:putative ABC transport system ATP-binding protein